MKKSIDAPMLINLINPETVTVVSSGNTRPMRYRERAVHCVQCIFIFRYWHKDHGKFKWNIHLNQN